MTKTNNPIF